MSGYIGNIPTPQATQSRDSFTATASQTSFATAGYTAGFLDVYLNGVHLLDSADYTATNGSDVVLTVGAAAGDVLEVVSYSTFEVLNPTFTGTTTVDTLAVTGTVDGRDIATDGAKLDGVEAGATADQTITLSGDATGSGTTSIVVTVADDSHNHVWGNIDGASVGGLAGPRFTTPSGWIEFGPANTSWAHINTDRPNFYFYKPLYVLGTPVLTGSGVPSTSASTVGSVGSYAWLWRDNAGASQGLTYAGSSLFYAVVNDDNATGAAANVYKGNGTVRSSTSPAGTWRSMGSSGSYPATYGQSTLYLRIS